MMRSKAPDPRKIGKAFPYLGQGQTGKAFFLGSCPLRNKQEQNAICAADWEVRNFGVPDGAELGRRQAVVMW